MPVATTPAGARAWRLHTPRAEILRILRAKSIEREVPVTRAGLRDPAVRDRSARDYAALRAQLLVKPPPFEAMFARVTAYYESLPWPAD